MLSIDACCEKIEVKKDHNDNSGDGMAHLFAIYVPMNEKVNGHAYYQSDPVYPPSKLLWDNPDNKT